MSSKKLCRPEGSIPKFTESQGLYGSLQNELNDNISKYTYNSYNSTSMSRDDYNISVISDNSLSPVNPDISIKNSILRHCAMPPIEIISTGFPSPVESSPSSTPNSMPPLEIIPKNELAQPDCTMSALDSTFNNLASGGTISKHDSKLPLVSSYDEDNFYDCD